MIPELLQIPIPFTGFSLPVYTFGFFMLCCFLGAMKLLEKQLEEVSFDTGIAEQLVTWAAIGGILGARILSIFSHPEALLNDPVGTIFSSSGFVFYGGFLGGFIGVMWVLKRNKLSPLAMSDVIAAPLAFGYGIGRIGCQLSGDGDYGHASSLPWAMNYAYGVVPVYETVHPTPVYETMGAFLLTWILISSVTRHYFRYQGQLFGLYLVISAVFRFMVEFLRIEPIVGLGLTQAQLFSLFLLITGMVFILRKNKGTSLFLQYGKRDQEIHR
jgi:phosphatidylglycerol---prolipoprotein diacylglyceryl transferase